MKDSKKYGDKIAKLYRKLKKEQSKVKPVEYDDPVDALVFATLCEHMPLPTARTSVRKIKKHFVDYNDLRVSRPEELLEVLATHDDEFYSAAKELSESLNEIYYKYDTLYLKSLEEMGKRQAKKELEELNTVSDFVVSYCFLTSLGGHAVPVSESMADYLRVEELVHPKASERDIEGFLERHIKSGNAYEFFVLLKNCSDVAAKKTAKKLEKAEKETKKKTTKKKTKKTKTKKSEETQQKTAKKKSDKKAKKTTKKEKPAEKSRKSTKKTENKSAKKSKKKTAKKTTKKKTTKKTAAKKKSKKRSKK